MTAGWTATSTTGNIMPDRRLLLLRLRNRCRLRLRPAVVSAAKLGPHRSGSLMGSLIGERVKSLRKECTGRGPVHFFRNVASAAAGLMLVAASGPAAAAPQAPVQAQQRAASLGQSVADFYRARNNYPLWLSPTAGNAA